MRCKFVTYEKQNNWLKFFYDDNKWFKKFVMKLGYSEHKYDQSDLLIFLQIPDITKLDILELFEYLILSMFWTSRIESDEIMIWTHLKLDKNDCLVSPNPTYISEYIANIGQLFLAGYIDFGSYCDSQDIHKTDYPSNLSHYKKDKYQAWIHFRNNYYFANKHEKIDNFILDDTFWDTPKYWNKYNIWVTRTQKGTQYFEKILAPKIYHKYKDLSVEIDDAGNIIKWIGKINRLEWIENGF